MTVHSAGILAYRFRGGELEVLLVHPGGPFWAGKDAGAWSIPKGIYADDEQPLEAAQREFREETGFAVDGPFFELGELQQASGKIVHAWAAEGDFVVSQLRSNTFTLEWPKGSGHVREYPEVDRGAWFGMGEAREKILEGQREFLDRLQQQVVHVP